jgi:hypothetical protein
MKKALLFGFYGAVGGAFFGIVIGRLFAVYAGAVAGFIIGVTFYKWPPEPD